MEEIKKKRVTRWWSRCLLGTSGGDWFECYKKVYVAVKSMWKTASLRALFIDNMIPKSSKHSKLLEILHVFS